MGKGGGTQVVKNELPEWLRPHVEGNIDRAQQISNIGYTAYDGPDVAAFSPMQTAAMQNTNRMARAFGMNAAPMSMPEPQTFGGGIQGYSSKPLMDHAINQLRENAPGQYAAIAGQFINPKTGAAPAAGPWGPQPEAGAAGGQKEEEIPNGYGKDPYGNIVPSWKLER